MAKIIDKTVPLVYDIEVMKIIKPENVPIPPIGRFEEMDLNFDGEVTLVEWKDFAYNLVSAKFNTVGS